MTEILALQAADDSQDEQTEDLPGFCSQASNACSNKD
jgi:hypothetical protein